MPHDDSEEASAIRRILQVDPGEGMGRGVTQPGDDGFALPDGTILAMDTMVEGVHYAANLDPDQVGERLVAVNVSDLGAMGARPTHALLSMALPHPLDLDWVDGFATGLHRGLQKYAMALVGGDTTRTSGPRVLSMSCVGKARHPVGRDGALVGDDLWVTGTLGGASAAFSGLGPDHPLVAPQPPVHFGVALADHQHVHAMMDLSDGLYADLCQLCRASGVGATVEPGLLPLPEALVNHPEAVSHAVAFGDDYQLLFAADPIHREEIQTFAEMMEVRVTRIGQITQGPRVELLGIPWPKPLYQHFAEPD